MKVYNTGREIFAVRWPSPLHGDLEVTPELLPVTDELRAIALAFGRVFGLKIYGVDLLATARGWVAVDVNDFPSFHEVPDAVGRIASSILEMADAMQRVPAEARRRLAKFKSAALEVPQTAGSTPV